MVRKLNITRLLSGGLITNYYCSSKCRHCLYRCSPFWPKDYITNEEAEAAFRLAKSMGCYSMHIGGGEPLLKPDRVAVILEIAQKVGMHIEYVETNSSWFKNLDQACYILENLLQRGLPKLLVSISPFHLEYIPLAKVKGVIKACQMVGIEIFPWTADFLNELSQLDESKPHKIEELEAIFGPGYLARLPSRYWIVPGGRALETFAPFHQKMPAESLIEIFGPCHELADTSHFHFDLYGNYIPGLCAGLAIMRKDLGKPLDPEKYPIISKLYSEGIKGLFEWAYTHFDFKPKKEGYYTKCALCYDIRRFLVVDKKLSLPDLNPKGHYIL